MVISTIVLATNNQYLANTRIAIVPGDSAFIETDLHKVFHISTGKVVDNPTTAFVFEFTQEQNDPEL